MTCHATEKCTEPGKMQHPVNGRAWKNFDTKYPNFKKEARNVRLGWAADSFNQFDNLSQSYSMWPTINDFPARSSLSGWSRKGYRACPTCNEDTSSMRVLSKTAYVGHRRFLKKPHKWRRSLDFNGEIENRDPPRKFDQDDIKAQLARLPTRVKGKHPMYGGVKIKHVMHIEKNVLESILNTLLMNDKSKDTTKARQYLKRLGIRSGLWLGQNKNGKCTKPHAAYSFTPGDRKKFCQFIKEALEGGLTRPRGMYPFEKFMKKLKNYVRNKAKTQDRNVDYPPPTCQFQALRSICKSIGLRSVIRIDHQELKKVMWYVLHNSLEIDTYRVKFKGQFPNKDMKEEFPSWFGSQICQRHVDKDICVSASSELFALAYGPTRTPISINSCVVNGVRFVEHNRDERRTTQNSGICSPCEDGEMYYGRVKHLVIRNNITQILANGESFKNDQYILATQVKQCFYLEDMTRQPLGWKVVEHVNHKKFSNGGVIVVEDDPDIIHVDNSSDLALTTTLNDLEIPALHINGQSIDVDAPLDIIDVDEDDNIIDDEDVLPYDLAYSNDEYLVNVDDDDGMSAYVARGHGGDGGGDDRPPPHESAGGCRGKGTRKPNLGGRKAGRMHTRKETRNLGLRKIIDELGPIPPERKAGVLGKIGIRFWSDPKNMARCAQNARNRAKSTVVCRQGSRTLATLRDMQMQSSATQEYPSLIQTFFDTHTVGGVFLRDEDRRLYLQSQHESGSGSGCGAGEDDESGDDANS
nr:hypothetical protein [Tanacetum cinerariifolium]